jgi:hypothetical protein
MYLIGTIMAGMAFLMVVAKPEDWIDRFVSYLKERNIYHG